MRLELVTLQITNSKRALIGKGFRGRVVEHASFINAFEGLGLQKFLKLLGLFVGSAHEPTVRTTLADCLLGHHGAYDIARLSKPQIF